MKSFLQSCLKCSPCQDILQTLCCSFSISQGQGQIWMSRTLMALWLTFSVSSSFIFCLIPILYSTLIAYQINLFFLDLVSDFQDIIILWMRFKISELLSWLNRLYRFWSLRAVYVLCRLKSWHIGITFVGGGGVGSVGGVWISLSGA